MADFSKQDLAGSTFEEVSLKDSRFHDVTLAGATFSHVDLTGVTIESAYFGDAVIRGDLQNVEIMADLDNVTINGVDIGPLVEAELDRRFAPYRVKMRPTDAAGFREAWDIVEMLWAETVARAKELPPAVLHESANGEWSFIETLRHLVFATDAWVVRQVLGDPSPWSPLDLPWDQMPDTAGIPRARDVRPPLDEVLALRTDRMATVRRLVDALSDQSLDQSTEPVPGPGWPESRSYPVRDCLLVVLNEEWEHRLYAERDLDLLEAGATDALPS